MCRSSFYGRADASYCSGACRQKAYRARMARESSDDGHVGDAVEHARQLRRRARLARKQARLISRKRVVPEDPIR
ncbi:hypothetical protein MMAN_14290 [Mycobacterium mantenii]|uniref:FLZ-type domain-containing protein n=1 Tax=Mycobacterium mantenii TaxID=560555 RepID=A0ABN6A2E5_MYCNT|nr:hypothetical protein MMAN_14290 [Mycobacterium mantenii]